MTLRKRLTHTSRHPIGAAKVVLPTVAVALLLAACCSSTNSSSVSTASAPTTPPAPVSASPLVMTANNTTIGATILVNSQGQTLYALSGEGKGKFICVTSACLQVWHPLLSSGVLGVVGNVTVGTVKRPNGATQMAYQGKPLYTFAGDQGPGSVKGQGVKDAGVWNVVIVNSSATAPVPTTKATPAPAPPTKYTNVPPPTSTNPPVNPPVTTGPPADTTPKPAPAPIPPPSSGYGY